MKEFIVKKEIRIQAQPAAVWDALTNPEKTKKYFFNCGVYSDWKEGSPIIFRGTIFLIKKIEMKGEIIEIVPQKLLRYTLQNVADKDESYSTVTDELSYENGETILSVTDDVGPGNNAAKRYKSSQQGWDKVLKALKELVEEEK